MMQMLRDQKPVSCPAIQFAGGEPTMREDIVRIIKMASEFGFTQVQMATNGIKLAKSLEFCKELYDAGLHTVYLQFDGVTGEPYLSTEVLIIYQLSLKRLRTAGLQD